MRVDAEIGPYWDWLDREGDSPSDGPTVANEHLRSLGVPTGSGAGVHYDADLRVTAKVTRVFVSWEFVPLLLERTPGLRPAVDASGFAPS